MIIGGGAAGLMAAITAAKQGHRVTVIEKNSRPARKLMITGKGRCNVTNNTDLDGLLGAVAHNGRFLYSAFSQFGPGDTMAFFEAAGVPLKTERGNRVFPVSDKAVDIVDALVNAAKKQKVLVLTGTVERLCVEEDKVIGVMCTDGRFIRGDRVIIATGGLSYPLTGSTGDGYRLAESVGHTVTPLWPSLVPLCVHEGWCSALQGLSLKNVSVRLYKGAAKKPVYTDFGEMLFTHYGVSGPLVLSASAHIDKPDATDWRLVIDLKPALDPAQLDARILRDFAEAANKNFANALGGLLPHKLIPIVVKLSGIDPTAKVNQITKAQRQALIEVLKNLTLHITGFRPMEEAVVTRGGVKVSEVDPSTMQSKRCEGLYFAGEVLDVDAYTGGFNLQIAFSTGYVAGVSV